MTNRLVSILLSVCLLFFGLPDANADKTQIIAKPKRCIKPRGEKYCIIDIKLEWVTSELGDYCVYQEGKSNFIQCWNNANKGRVNIVFKSNDALIYYLKQTSQNIVLSTIKIDVVYSLKKKRHNSKKKKRLWHVY